MQLNKIYDNEGIGLYIKDVSKPKTMKNNKVGIFFDFLIVDSLKTI